MGGIRGVEWDAVELPSQFMENWCYHKNTLMSFAKHYKTGETLPDDLYDKLVAAKNYRCNQTPPIGDKPSLMTFREVETLFHETGHALQHMLTQQDCGHVAGIRGVEWDAVELPSQFMENWCYHKTTLMSFAKHYKTGEILPDDLYDK